MNGRRGAGAGRVKSYQPSSSLEIEGIQSFPRHLNLWLVSFSPGVYCAENSQQGFRVRLVSQQPGAFIRARIYQEIKENLKDLDGVRSFTFKWQTEVCASSPFNFFPRVHLSSLVARVKNITSNASPQERSSYLRAKYLILKNGFHGNEPFFVCVAGSRVKTLFFNNVTLFSSFLGE